MTYDGKTAKPEATSPSVPSVKRQGPDTVNHMERRILVVTCFGHFLSHFNMLVFPAVVLPLVGIVNLSMREVLGLSFMQYLLFGIMALPWEWPVTDGAASD